MKPKKTKQESLNIAYESDASQLKGIASKVILPKNILEVQQAVRENLNVTARGGGTGLAGGAVPCGEGCVVIDMSKMNKILKFNKERRTIEVETGIILDELNEFLENYGLEFPVNPSSHEVCTIGGMISTNAVGSRALKYGRTDKWIDWIEVVDSSGSLVRKGKTELSDFAGMEGISGIIVKAGLRLTEKPERSASLIKRETLNELIALAREIKRNPSVSMIEFLDKKVSAFIGLESKYHLFIEYESQEGDLKAKDYEDALSLRDKIYPVLADKGFSRIEDPKVFLDRIQELIEWLEKNKIPVYGHLSVGILHPCFSKENEKKIEEMMKFVKKLNGQVSGEHGIGLLKKKFLDENDKKIIRLIKQRNDPSNKFNPGKVV